LALARGTAGAGDADMDMDAAFMDAADTATDVAATDTAHAVVMRDAELTPAEQPAVTLAELAVRRLQDAVDLVAAALAVDSPAVELAAVAVAMVAAAVTGKSLGSAT